MRLLIDTHTFIWFVTNHRKLSQPARVAICDPLNGVFVSVASAWEMSIKYASGKLTLSDPPEQYVPRHLAANRFKLVNISLAHVFRAGSLPPHHGDPFDRLLVAQSLGEPMTLVSRDRQFDQYSVTRLW